MTATATAPEPRFHVRPPSGWANDPNGPFRWRGRYHLFYQHNPGAPVHADIHWGHASSADLARWEHHPVALAPTPGGPDEAGCWSGCVVDDGGTPTAVYTGVAGAGARIHLGTVCLAHAEDEGLLRWRQLATPVVDGPPDGLDVVVFRDPFVFRHEGRRWALVGAGHADGTPSVLLYDCEDLKAWRYAGVLLDGRDPVAARAGGAAAASAWECPQLFATGAGAGDWVLVVSLWRGDPQSVAYLTGSLSAAGDGLAFAPRAAGPVDLGRDFYAPTVLAEEHRTLLWGWSWESRPQAEVEAAGWAGLLTFPREVSTDPGDLGDPGDTGGGLRVRPARELARLRGEPLAEGAELPDAYELHVTADGGPGAVELLRSASGRAVLTLRLDPDAGRVVLDRPGGSGPLVLPTPVAAARVLVDGSVLEVYAGDGHAVATERVYRRPGDTARLAVSGAALRVTGWELASAPPRNAGSPGTGAA